MPVDDIVLMLMADYGLKLYGNAIIVNPKFAAEKPEAVKAFLRAYPAGPEGDDPQPGRRGRPDRQARGPARKSEVELERLRMAIRDNIVTPEVRANGFGAVDRGAARGGDRPDRR